MSETLYSISDTKLTSIADAIRSQTEDDRTMTTDDMVTKINNMMNSVCPFVGIQINAELIEGVVRRVLVGFDEEEFAIQEVQNLDDPTGEYTDHDYVCTPGFINRRDEFEEVGAPVGGIKMRSNGMDMFINTSDIYVDIHYQNVDDDTDSGTFHGQYDSGSYAFDWFDGDAHHYEIVFDKGEEEKTYQCTIYALVANANDWNLMSDYSSEYTCTVVVPAYEEEQEEDPGEGVE